MSNSRGKRRRRSTGLQTAIEFHTFVMLQRFLGKRRPSTSYRLVETVLLLAFYFVPDLRRRSLDSLAIAFGDRSLAWRRHIMWESTRHLAWTVADWIMLPYLFRPGLAERFDVEEATQLLERLASSGRGVVTVGSHQGNADAVSCAISRHLQPKGIEAVAAVRQLSNMRINDFLVAQRSEFGRQTSPKKGYVKRAASLVEQGGVACLLIDQDAGSQNGIFVPFFGRLASTTHGAASILRLSGGQCVCMFPLRTGYRSLGYTCHIVGPLEIEETGDRTEDTRAWTAAMTAVVEDFARRYPSQVLWAHRRWKSRPLV